MKLHILISMFVLVVLGGCAVGQSKFSCPGMPEGVSCMSAREVYQATNNADKLGTKYMNADGSYGAPVENQLIQAALPIPAIDRPIPIRSQAKVLRIWFAPWQTESGDLNVPGYAYTEIEPRRWNMGENLVLKQRSAAPFALQVNNLPQQNKAKDVGSVVKPAVGGVQQNLPFGQIANQAPLGGRN
jgi:conjugal transfer pilus assembly protein TraV